MKRKTLIACCGAHIVQDGLVALQYVLFPILAQAFNLSYAQVGILRALSHGGTTALEVPAGILAEKFGEKRLLVFGLICVGLGYIGVAYSPGFWPIAICLALAGVGGGFQHSLSSSLIVKTFDLNARRKALGAYNSSGDGGKLLFSALFSASIGAGLAWDMTLTVLGLLSMGFGVWIWTSLHPPTQDNAINKKAESKTKSKKEWGIRHKGRFAILGMIVFLDSMIQAVFLVFLAFIMLDKGLTQSLASACVVIALIGGMTGKFICGWLAARFGDRLTFIFLQVLTVIGITMLVMLPAMPLLMLLPLIGLTIQGTSTVTYGSVSDYLDQDRQSRGYALIYTIAASAGAIGPFAFGILLDHSNFDFSNWMMAITAAMALPLSFVLSRHHAS